MAADAEAAGRPLVVSIVGTRPEAIKMAPVVRALQGRAGLRQELILTGQHRGLEAHFDLGRDAIRKLDLNLSEQTAGEIREAIREELCGRWLRRRADLVLVQGDTASAAAGALAARDCVIPVGHVEAGLRSGDLQQPWPEEGNRICIDSIADLLFAPTELAAEHLLREHVRGTVHVTGNTGIDALLSARYACPTLPWHHDRKIVLVTCHRRENWPVLTKIASALKELVRDLPVDVFFLLHTNPRLANEVRELLGSEAHINLLAPRDYQDMVCLMDRSWLILTDSGGLQEEGPALGKPVLVLRARTERSEAIATDNVELVGTHPQDIVTAVARLLHDPERYRRMSQPSFPFGDGHAAPRIAALVEDFLGNRMPHLALSRHFSQEKDLA